MASFFVAVSSFLAGLSVILRKRVMHKRQAVVRASFFVFGQIFQNAIYMYVHMEYNEPKKNGQHPRKGAPQKEETF